MAIDIVISVVCTNNRAALEGCLEALPVACTGLQWEVTVVDNASLAGTSEMVKERFGWARLVRNERRMGFSHNHNLTIVPTVEGQKARYVVALNDDTVLDREALTKMVAEMDEDPSIGVLGPRIRGTDGIRQQSLFRYPSVGRIVARHLQIAGPGPAPKGDGWLNGSCLLLRVSAIEAVGPLDPEFFIFYEDTDIGRRLADAGWRSALSDTAGMVHLEHQTISSPALSSPMAFQMLRSQWIYIARHHSRTQAAVASAGTRAALTLRWTKARVMGLLGNEPERAQARQLLEPARYRPAEPLPHEIGG